jgi:PTH1 family peptidyl-tRNA hydrolase
METKTEVTGPILAIIGLGNPGPQYRFNRHNIGFMVVDRLCERHAGTWEHKELMDIATVQLGGHKVLLVKPQQFMNRSGCVIASLNKQGIKPENILVVHDELEYPFGKIKIRFDGSARGHNGLRSIIEACGTGFARLRFGIGRPERKEMVGGYVLQNFIEPDADVEALIEQAADLIQELF